MKTLIVTVGLPRSGKTTFARSLNCPIVNPDSIRLALCGDRFLAPAEPMVWCITYYMAEALFLAGHETVVIDATNTTAKRRVQWKEWAEKVHVLSEFKVLDTPPSECKRRALAMGDTYILPVIDRMAAEWDMDKTSWPPEDR